MNPEQYEYHVAAILTAEGWTTSVTRFSRDMGVDVLAERDGRRLAVQAKMYGGTATKVNAEQVMHLYGAAAYADCSEQMIATDGELTPDARGVADKLGVSIRAISAEEPADILRSSLEPGATAADTSFGSVWELHITPLKGSVLERGPGKIVQILEVDGSGVRRITSGNTKQHIRIETFRWAIDRLLAGEHVTRTEIHERDPRKVSSGVLLILSHIPSFELFKLGRLKAIRPRGNAPFASV